MLSPRTSRTRPRTAPRVPTRLWTLLPELEKYLDGPGQGRDPAHDIGNPGDDFIHLVNEVGIVVRQELGELVVELFATFEVLPDFDAQVNSKLLVVSILLRR